MEQDIKSLRVPRDATFPSLPIPESFEEYAHAYFLAASNLYDAIPKHAGIPW